MILEYVEKLFIFIRKKPKKNKDPGNELLHSLEFVFFKIYE